MNDLERTASALPTRTGDAWRAFGDELRKADRFSVSPTGEAILADKGGSEVLLARLRPAAKSLMLAALGERWEDFWVTYGRSKVARLTRARATFPGELKSAWAVLLKMGDANLMWVRVPVGWPDGESLAWGVAAAEMGDGFIEKERAGEEDGEASEE